MGKVTEASKRNSTRAFPDELICKHAQAVTKLMQEQDQALDKVPNIAKTQLKPVTYQHTCACPYKVDYDTGSPSWVCQVQDASSIIAKPSKAKHHISSNYNDMLCMSSRMLVCKV